MLPSFRPHRICLPALLLTLVLPGTADAQEKFPDFFDLKAGTVGFEADPPPPTVEATLTRTSADSARLDVTVAAPEGHYIYSMTTPFGLPTRINVEPVAGLSAKGTWRADHEAKSVYDDVIEETMEKYYGPVTWSLDLTIPATADNGLRLSGAVLGQFCSDAGQCFEIKPPIPFEATLVSAAVPADDAPGSKSTETEGEAIAAVNIQHEFKRGSGSQKAPIRFRIEAVTVGDRELELRIHATIDRPYHTFSLHQDPDDAGLPTEIFLDTTTGLEPLGDSFTESKEPQLEEIRELDVVQKIHFDEVTFSRRFRRTADEFVIAGAIDWQVCRDGTCLPPTSSEFRLASADGVVEPPAIVSPQQDGATSEQVAATRGGGPDQPAGADSALDSAQPKQTTAGTGVSITSPNDSLSLAAFVWTAVLAGFVSLLTPCVFPMIPVTVSFFLKQGENGKSPLGLALIYCGGIILAFTAIGLIASVVFGPAFLTRFANNAWLNLFIAAVFIVFAAMLMGMFEIRIPSWMLTWSSKQESRGGIVGVIFMALTFTLVSFTCTFAFIGPLLVTAARGEEFFRPIVGMLAFSTAFASPFFILALFPQLLKKLPKSGGWMNTVKVTMGFIEIGIALKYLSVADIGFSSDGTPVFFDYTMVFTIWVVVSLATGLYLLGLFRLPHDSPTDSISPLRCMFALMFLSFGGYMIIALATTVKPTGELWAQLEAFAPPRLESHSRENASVELSSTGDGSSTVVTASYKTYTPPDYLDQLGQTLVHDGLPYGLDFDKAIAIAREQNLPVFVDVTGVNCVNCRKMEKKVLPQIRNFNLLKQCVRVQLYVDRVPTVEDSAEEQRLIDRNTELQLELFGTVGLPAYAVVDPDDLTVLSRMDYDESGDVFYAAFEMGLERFQQRARKVAAGADLTQR